MTIVTASMRNRWKARETREKYPYQVALPEWHCTGENFYTIRRFCAERFGVAAPALSIRARWEHGGDEDMRLYCFSTYDEARIFADHFEAQHFDESEVVDRTWMRRGGWSQRVCYGPLEVPKWVRENP